MLRERANRVVDLPPESVKTLLAADVRPTIDDKIKARAVDATMPITAHTLAAPISLPPRHRRCHRAGITKRARPSQRRKLKPRTKA